MLLFNVTYTRTTRIEFRCKVSQVSHNFACTSLILINYKCCRLFLWFPASWLCQCQHCGAAIHEPSSNFVDKCRVCGWWFAIACIYILHMDDFARTHLCRFARQTLTSLEAIQHRPCVMVEPGCHMGWSIIIVWLRWAYRKSTSLLFYCAVMLTGVVLCLTIFNR